MRVLGIDTCSRRGSVALLDTAAAADALELSAEHEQPNAHAEQLLPLLERCLAEAGWRRTQLDVLAVDVGPGSFTGLRVGIAFARGVALGLGVPLLGVGSLRALAAGAGPGDPLRLALLDARRGELFAAAYAGAQEVLAPRAVPRRDLTDLIAGLSAHPELVGEVARELGHHPVGPGLPHAREVARLAADSALTLPPEAVYVRAPDAKEPKLPPSPL